MKPKSLKKCTDAAKVLDRNVALAFSLYKKLLMARVDGFNDGLCCHLLNELHDLRVSTLQAIIAKDTATATTNISKSWKHYKTLAEYLNGFAMGNRLFIPHNKQ